MIFDHDHSLLGADFEGIERLDEFQDELGLKMLTHSEDSHPFLKRVDSRDLFDMWFDRIYSIPDWFIEAVCLEACSYDINKTQAKKIISFLQYRKSNLERIIQLRLGKFTALPDNNQNEGLFK